MVPTENQLKILNDVLKQAMERRSTDLIATALDKGASPSVLFSDKDATAFCGKDVIIKAIGYGGGAAADSYVRAITKSGKLPQADADVIKTVLAKGGDVNLLLVAGIAGKAMHVVKAAVEDGKADLAYQRRSYDDTNASSNDQPLIIRINNNFDEKIAEYLLGKGVDINGRAHDAGDTALLQLCDNGSSSKDLDRIKFYLRHGADPFVENAKGKSAMSYWKDLRNADISVGQQTQDEILLLMLKNVKTVPESVDVLNQNFNAAAGAGEKVEGLEQITTSGKRRDGQNLKL